MSRFFARLIGKEDFAKWDELVERHRTIFQSIKWTEIFEPHIKRVGIFNKNGELVGGFSYIEKNIAGLKILRNPSYTPQIGPFFKLKAQKRLSKLEEIRAMLEAIVNFINEEKPSIVTLALTPSIIDTLPFYWSGFKVSVNYTYRLDLSEPDFAPVLLKKMDVKRRNDIKKAQMNNIYVEKSKDITALVSLVERTFKRQKKNYPRYIMGKILEKFSPQSNSSFLMMARQENEPVAGVYVVHDARIAFNLITGLNAEKAYRGVGALLLFEAIKEARRRGLKIFDFEGSMIPSIEKFFRGFGGDLTPYYRVNKAWLPIEMILKFFKRQYF